LRTKIGGNAARVGDGADEIDMVIDRGAFLPGIIARFMTKSPQSVRLAPAHLKVILETGELVTYDNVRLASQLAMERGGFIKTSTGKASQGRRFQSRL